MKKDQLQSLLDTEIYELSRRPYTRLVDELSDVVSYERGSGSDYHQFEVQMIEHELEYVHVVVSIDDGSFKKFISPISRSFIVHRDGRIEM